MTNIEIEKIKKWINDKLPDFKCELCSCNNWNIHQNLILTHSYEQLIHFQVGYCSDVSPQIMLMCKKNCTNKKYFNALMMGIISQDAFKPII